MDIRHSSVLDVCSLCIEGIAKNTPMKLRTHVEVRPAAVIRACGAVMNVLSITREWHLDTFVDETPSHLRTSHMKSKSEAGELLKFLVFLGRAIVLLYGKEDCAGRRKILLQGLEGC